jgi:hypothetical protein
MHRLSCALVMLAAAATAGLAQQPKPIRFWNLTLQTVTHLELSPAGQNAWGPDQCANDRDGTVDHDERLRITGIAPGRYDVRISDKGGRVCIVRNLPMADGSVFTVEEKDLTDCGH